MDLRDNASHDNDKDCSGGNRDRVRSDAVEDWGGDRDQREIDPIAMIEL